MVRILFTQLLFFAIYERGASQVYIGPIIGYEFNKISNIDSRIEYNDVNFTKSGYSNNSVNAGIKITMIESKHLFFSLRSSIAYNKVEAIRLGALPIDHIKFTHFKNNLLINYWKGKIFIGGGPSLNFIKNIKYIYTKYMTKN